MQRIRFSVLAMVLIAGPIASSAQTPSRPSTAVPQLQDAKGEVRGSVLDESGAPVVRASVAVRSKLDSALVAGAMRVDSQQLEQRLRVRRESARGLRRA